MSRSERYGCSLSFLGLSMVCLTFSKGLSALFFCISIISFCVDPLFNLFQRFSIKAPPEAPPAPKPSPESSKIDPYILENWVAANRARMEESRYAPHPDEPPPKVRRILDAHYDLMAEIKQNYRRRDENPCFLDDAIRACEEQIALAPLSAKYMQFDFPDGLPEHTGYLQLAIIREKQGDFAEAIRLSEEADKAGWGTEWDSRIARLRKKLAKKPAP